MVVEHAQQKNGEKVDHFFLDLSHGTSLIWSIVESNFYKHRFSSLQSENENNPNMFER